MKLNRMKIERIIVSHLIIVVFNNIDKIIMTLFNEPSLGLYYTQQHIQNSFPSLLNNMDRLYENRKTINNTIQDLDRTEKEIKEMSLKAINLYRKILKLHKIKLPLDMRELGDKYIKNEFKLFKNVTNENQLANFYIEWNTYLKLLKNFKSKIKISLKNSNFS